MGFERVATVEEVGQFAVRGGILDLFSFGSPDPVRIEMWGDEIASIRAFDILDQRSTGQASEVHVLPVDFRDQEEEGGATVSRSLLELLPAEAVLVALEDDAWDAELRRTWDQVVQFHDQLEAAGREPAPPSELFLEPGTARPILDLFPRLVVRQTGGGDVELATSPPPAIERDMDRLQALLRQGAAQDERTLILCDNEGQVHRLEEILAGERGRGSLPPGSQVGIGSVDAGFVLDDADPVLRVLTDHEVFRRSRRVRRGRRFRGA
ncbi:MAG: hypothetical protein KY453_10855, partial [Gemmatimonadetes bacterium]|nr:hypothetical protein [Gemmatimonadota bacterium]